MVKEQLPISSLLEALKKESLFPQAYHTVKEIIFNPPPLKSRPSTVKELNLILPIS